MQKRLKKTLTVAIGLFLFDGLFFGQGVISAAMCFWMVAVALPCAFLTRDRPERAFLFKRAAIYIAGTCMVFAWLSGNNALAKVRAEKLVTAIKAYHDKYQAYPKKLSQLAPEFIDHVALAKYVCMGQFFYLSKDGDDPTILFYIEFPPFDRRIYDFGTG